MVKPVLPGSGEQKSETQKSAGVALRLPSVDKLLSHPVLQSIAQDHGRAIAKRAVQDTFTAIRSGEFKPDGDREDDLADACAKHATHLIRPRLSPVINLTGTVIHTNLGRALLGQEAIASVVEAMQGYNALEFDLQTGERGDRDSVVEEIICRLTGAQAATVVNNCAAAVLLSLVALGARREVIISRSEQIEIGGSFRMPDIMRAANCRLVEVGTTNRTHLRDYAQAISEKSSLIVKAHRSNYAVTGFTAEVSDAELATLAHEHGLFYMVDLGSGALIDMSRWGLPREPLPSDSLSVGADVVMFSGDKLLGGPQAGIIVGGKEAISKIKKHPLKRTMRVSKLVLAALEATLRIYDSEHELEKRLPVLGMLSRSREDIRACAQRIAPSLGDFAGKDFQYEVVDCASQIGSGALPEERLPSAAVRISLKEEGRRPGRYLMALLTRFRGLSTPVIGRIKDDSVFLDCRCLGADDEKLLISMLK